METTRIRPKDNQRKACYIIAGFLLPSSGSVLTYRKRDLNEAYSFTEIPIPPVKRFTTSAQKTLSVPTAVILKKLEAEMTKDAALVFHATRRENIREARLEDGSKLVIAGFDQGGGKTLAMIDLKDLPGNNDRATIQKSLRQKLDSLF